MTLADAVRDYSDVKYLTVYRRVERGWTIRQALGLEVLPRAGTIPSSASAASAKRREPDGRRRRPRPAARIRP